MHNDVCITLTLMMNCYLRVVVKRCFITLLMFLLTFEVHAQDQKVIDSLKTVIQNAEHDTSICNAYLSWGEQLYLRNPDTAIKLFHKAREIAKINLAASPTLTFKKKYLSSLAGALNNTGYIYSDQGNIAKALEYFFECLKIDELLGNRNGVANSLNNIGYIYINQGDNKLALEYYIKSLAIRKDVGDRQGVALALNNIGTFYENQGDNQLALEYFVRSLTIREELEDKYGVALSLNNIGHIYLNKVDYQMALKYFFKSLKIKEELEDKKGIANSLNSIAGVLLAQGQIVEAREHAEQSLNIARDIRSPNQMMYTAGTLKKVAAKQGNYKEALKMYELHIQMRDSIKNEETQKASIRQQTKYEFEKAQLVKEQEEREAARLVAEKTARRDNLQYSVVLICLLVIGVLVAMLGRLSLPERMAEGIIFFSFLILFEFLLVLADPYIENWSGGAPGIKLLFNAGIAALIFPMHSVFETKLKRRLVK